MSEKSMVDWYEEVVGLAAAGLISRNHARRMLECRGLSSDVPPARRPPAHDRSGCLWFCGMTALAMSRDQRRYGGRGVPFGRMSFDLSMQAFCSDRCRDLGVGPLEEQPVVGQMGGALSPEGLQFDAKGVHADMPPIRIPEPTNAIIRRYRPAPPPAPPSGITCRCCRVTSPDGKAHLERCEVPQPSAVAAAPRPYVFVTSVSEWDLLPDADR